MPKASQKFRKKQKVASVILTATMIANSTAFTFANEVEQPQEEVQTTEEQATVVEEAPVEEETPVVEEAPVEEEVPAVEETVLKEEVTVNKTAKEDVKDESAEVSFLNSLVNGIKGANTIDVFKSTLDTLNIELANPLDYISDETKAKYEAMAKDFASVLDEALFANSLIAQLNSDDIEQVNRITNNILQSSTLLTEGLQGYFKDIIEKDGLTNHQVEEMQYVDTLIPQIESSLDGFEIVRLIKLGDDTIAAAKLPDRFLAKYNKIFGDNYLNDKQCEDISFLNSLVSQIESCEDAEEVNRLIGVAEEELANANIPSRFVDYFNAKFDENRISEEMLSDISFLNSLIPQIEGLTDGFELNRVIGVGEEALASAKLPERFAKKYKEIFAANKLTDKQCEDISFISSVIEQMKTQDDYNELRRLENVVIDALKEAVDVNKLPERFVTHLQSELDKVKLTQVQFEDASFVQSIIDQLYASKLEDRDEVKRLLGVAQTTLDESTLPQRVKDKLQRQLDKFADIDEDFGQEGDNSGDNDGDNSGDNDGDNDGDNSGDNDEDNDGDNDVDNDEDNDEDNDVDNDEDNDVDNDEDNDEDNDVDNDEDIDEDNNEDKDEDKGAGNVQTGDASLLGYVGLGATALVGLAGSLRRRKK